jgi:outer membrane protein assembly factor BamA
VFRDQVANGIRLRYVLVPSHPVDRVEFRGMPGLPLDDLRRVVRERYGEAPPERRMAAVLQLLKDTYQARGYPQAMVDAHIDPTHNPDRASMVFEIQAHMGDGGLVMQAVDVMKIDDAGRLLSVRAYWDMADATPLST